MKKTIVYTLLYLFLGLCALICLVPFYFMIINMTRTGQEIMMGFTFLPGTNLVNNWNKLIEMGIDLFGSMARSAFIAITTTFLGCYFSALTAYTFAFYKFPGSNVLFTALIAFMMVPSNLGMFGLYDVCNQLGIINTFWPLIIPSIAQIGTVFFLRQYCVAMIPKSMLEAPRIDGASEIRIFHSIVLPVMVPGIATVGIGMFIGGWNQYMGPLILISDPDKYLVTQVISILNATRDISQNQGVVYLCLALSVAPILLMFAFFSKYFISSITAGAFKE